MGGALAENIKASLRQRPSQPIRKEKRKKRDLNTKWYSIMASNSVRPMQTKHKEIVQIHKASFILQIGPIFIKSKIV